MSKCRSGRCLCGDVTFEFEGEPNWVAHCHCESCRRTCGAPVTTFIAVARSGARYPKAQPAVFGSSPGVRRHFCGKCGSPLAYDADDYPHEIHFYVAALDNPNDYEATKHVFAREQLDWFEVHDDLPRLATEGPDSEILRHGPRNGK